MTDLFVMHQLGLALFVAVLLLVALSNLLVIRRLGEFPTTSSPERVSILVPARDEEHNIGPCVRSLLAQDYPDFEVVVLDDDSSDATHLILEALATETDRLRVLRGEPLPTGWLGKHWACHQLALAARGELLLFTDADTIHHPLALRDAVSALQAEQIDLLSLIPLENVETWGERLVVPVIPWSVLSFLPLALAHRSQASILSMGIGQFMLFRRESYTRAGGHQAIRLKVADDISLARRIKDEGMRWRLLDGTSRVQCRMYRDARQVYNGFSKGLSGVFDKSVAVHIFVWLWLGIVFLQPIVVLGFKVAGAAVPAGSLVLAAWTCLSSLLLWGLAYRRFGIPLYLSLFYPLTVSLVVYIAMRSVIVSRAGRAVWKGRLLPYSKSLSG